MGFTPLNMLWLVPAFTLTTQEMVGLSVSPQITAEYGKPVTLQCNVTAKSPNKLEIKHMEWSQNKAFLCSVNGKDNMTTNNPDTLRDFHCEYKNQQLSLILQNVQPMEVGSSNPYMCKLKSNQGAAHSYSRLELEECCVMVEGNLTSRGPSCTFKHVYPDGEVHWFHGAHHLSDRSLQRTSKRVEKGGWLTIHSYLERNSSGGPYNCSLKSTRSDRYIASALVHSPEAMVIISRGHASSYLHSKGVATVRTLLYIPVLLAVTAK